jgi:hypothetical protein
MSERAIYVLKDQQKTGPYSLEEVYQRIWKGQAAAYDLAWEEGETEWVTLDSLLKKGEPVFVPDAALKRLYKIAYYQRATNWCVLAFLGLVAALFFGLNETLMGILGTPVVLYGAYAFIRFLIALCRWWTPLWLVISLVPFVFLGVLYVIGRIATRMYNEGGFQAGVMGLTRKSFQDLKLKLEVPLGL